MRKFRGRYTDGLDGTSERDARPVQEAALGRMKNFERKLTPWHVGQECANSFRVPGVRHGRTPLARLITRSLGDKHAQFTVETQLIPLIVHRGPQDHDTGRILLDQFYNLQSGVERIA